MLPSLSSLAETDVIECPERFLELADRVEAAGRELAALEAGADPSEVVRFLALFAQRKGMDLPDPALLAMDAGAVVGEVPADLLALAFQRLWARFGYRRLPEPPDFVGAVREEIAERREAAARVRTVALKVETARMYARLASAPARTSAPRPRTPTEPPTRDAERGRRGLRPLGEVSGPWAARRVA